MHVSKTSHDNDSNEGPSSTDIAKCLVHAALEHLKEHQCSKVVTLAQDVTGREALVATGFGAANMLTMELNPNVVQNLGIAQNTECQYVTTSDDQTFVCMPAGQQHDTTVCSHWAKMWKKVGIPESALIPTMNQVTTSFIQMPATTSWVIKPLLRIVVGLTRWWDRCLGQVWQGPMPQIVQSLRLGTIWAVYVDPAHRRCGIATTLMKMALTHLYHRVGCQQAILIAGTARGLIRPTIGFTQNVGRLGRGFDLQKLLSLADSIALARKFDRLAACNDDWTVVSSREFLTIILATRSHLSP